MRSCPGQGGSTPDIRPLTPGHAPFSLSAHTPPMPHSFPLQHTLPRCLTPSLFSTHSPDASLLPSLHPSLHPLSIPLSIPCPGLLHAAALHTQPCRREALSWGPGYAAKRAAPD